jgi:hypothetical protein
MLSKQRASQSSGEINPQVRLLVTSAERELSAFVSAVDGQFGVEQAHRFALDWIEKVSLIRWPVSGAMPNWRKATLGASIRLGNSVSVLQAAPTEDKRQMRRLRRE